MAKGKPAAESTLIVNPDAKKIRRRLIVGTPTLGNVRMEWVLGRYSQIIPCNWSMMQTTEYIATVAPLGYLVADAQNLIVRTAVEGDFEWLLFIEDDTIPPPDAFLKLNEYMRSEEFPVVSGLYYTKSHPAEPLIYREMGFSYYDDFAFGDKVWASGIPTGFFLCSMKVMRLMYEESEEYLIGDQRVRRVFEQPERMWYDPQIQAIQSETGTSDLAWCKRVRENNYLGRAGWKKIGRKKYPFLVDTAIFCRHITPDGRMYPSQDKMPNPEKRKKK